MADWICVRQRAGPLVKECRAIRPRLSAADSQYDRTEKNKILRPPRDSSVCCSRVDRLELRLALFWFEGRAYALSFDQEHEPEKFRDVRKVWRSFLYQLKKKLGRPFDYAYLIEGRHGDHRYHLHLVLRDSDFSPAVVRSLWRYGEDVDAEPLLLHPQDSYRRTAKYFNKEATDGVRIPISSRTWVCSRSLVRQLPEPERFTADSGMIQVPADVMASGQYATGNEWGQYRYAWYIEEQKQN